MSRRIDYPKQLYNAAFTGGAVFDAGSVSLRFDQVGGKTTLEQDTAAAVGIANSWTIMGWHKNDNALGDGVVFELGRNNLSQDGIAMYTTHTNGNARIILRTGSTIFKDYTFSWTGTFGEWLHTVVTWNGTNLRAWQNGVEDTTPTTSTDNAGSQTDVAREVAIGANTRNTADAYLGLVHQAAAWSSVLSSSEIAAIYNSGNGNAVDLSASFGDYASQGSLVQWYRPGAMVSPNLGINYVEGGIDLDEFIVNDGDIEQDAPTG